MVCKRTPFYSMSLSISLNHANCNSFITVVALFTSILQSVFGTLAGFVNGRSPLLREFALLPPIHPTPASYFTLPSYFPSYHRIYQT